MLPQSWEMSSRWQGPYQSPPERRGETPRALRSWWCKKAFECAQPVRQPVDSSFNPPIGLLQAVARIGDRPVQRTGRHGQRAGEENLGLAMAHAAGEIAVR